MNEEEIFNNLIEAIKQLSNCIKVINERINLLEMEIRLIKEKKI